VISTAFGPIDRYVYQEFFASAQRRAAAVALAIRLYRIDHHAWPPSLDHLVPSYLPLVPADPLAAGNRPIGYIILRGALPGGGDRPMLFTNAVDAAHAGMPPAAPSSGWSPGATQWCDLERWSPPPTGSGGN
jgi:hypothetical protein